MRSAAQRKGRLRHGDYVLQVFNVNDDELVPIHRAQNVSIDVDFGTEITQQLSDDGFVQEEDTTTTTLSFDLNLISEHPVLGYHPLSWLAAIAGKPSHGSNTKRVFNVGRSLNYHGGGTSSSTRLSDFDAGDTQGSTRLDGWVATRDPGRFRNKLARVNVMANAQVTSIGFNIPVDGVANASATMEMDYLSVLIQSLKGAQLGVRTATATDETNQTITIDTFQRVAAVWVNYREIPDWMWSESGTTAIDFSNASAERCSDWRLRNGDVVKYVYLPTVERTWEDYLLLSGANPLDAEMDNSQSEVFFLSDTTQDRFVHGFYPIRRDQGVAIVTSNALPLAAGHVYIGGDLYYAGFEDGIADIGTNANQLVDGAFSGASYPNDVFNGATVTMLTGDAAGQTLTVEDFVSATGTFTFVQSFMATPNPGDQFRINAMVLNGPSAVGEDSIYVGLDGSGNTQVTLEDKTAPPSNALKIAEFNDNSSFVSYIDAREFQRTRLERVQAVDYALDLSRETVEELGYEATIDRHLNIPVQITTEVTLIDSDEEIYELTTGDSNQLSFLDLPGTLGIQVVMYRDRPQTAEKPYEESKQRIVLEVVHGKPSDSTNNVVSGGSGDIGFTIWTDNWRAISIA